MRQWLVLHGRIVKPARIASFSCLLSSVRSPVASNPTLALTQLHCWRKTGSDPHRTSFEPTALIRWTPVGGNVTSGSGLMYSAVPQFPMPLSLSGLSSSRGNHFLSQR